MQLKRVLLVVLAFALLAGCTTTNNPASSPVSQPVGGNFQWCITPNQEAETCYELAYSPGMTAESSLRKLDSDKPDLQIETTSSQYGTYISAVNGYTPGSTAFWEFVVNGKQAAVGISVYQVVPGDKLALRLAEINR